MLSNSRQNGIEFIMAAGRVAEGFGLASKMEIKGVEDIRNRAVSVENMRMEIRIKLAGRVGKIIVLSANPRTARGFSGDLILDEFAFHEDSTAIWDAAEPIISSNPDFLCRIASTGNGRFNTFYRMASEASPYTVSRVRRTEAYKMGVKIYDAATRKPITPEKARSLALDKASYDQNYECTFNDEASALLTHTLIDACEYKPGEEFEWRIESQDWGAGTLEFLRNRFGPLNHGVDIGRTRNLTVIATGEKIGGVIFVRSILRLEQMRLPDQLKKLAPVLAMSNFGRGSYDSTGLGTGLVEFAQDQPGVGQHRAEAVSFSSKERREGQEGAEREDSALVTELMALDLLKVFEDHAIKIPPEMELRDDLRKPQRVVSAKGSVRIAATDDRAGHADAFWALALLVRSLKSHGGTFAFDSRDSLRDQEDEARRMFNRRDQRGSVALM